MGTDPVIYIRTDGNAKIATGHLVRCLCIAQALESLGKSVCFLVSDADSSNLLLNLAASFFQGYSFSFDVKILETAVYDNLEAELEELRTLLKESPVHFNPDTKIFDCRISPQPDNIQCLKPRILLDSYFVTQKYLNSLREYAYIAYMDDLRAFDYNVDLIINYDVIPPSKKTEYQQAYTNAELTLLGAKYTPLRSQFQNQSITLRETVGDILITTGGSDPYHFTEAIVSYLLSQELAVNLHVVIGKLFTDTETLERLAAQSSNLKLYSNISNMAALMKQCDYAISAAGTTLYELCALGIPAISFTMADNQIIMAETFAETETIPYAGDIRTENLQENNALKNETLTSNLKSSNMEFVLNNINNHLNTLIRNPKQRIIQCHNMRRLVDGNGAIKIAEALLYVKRIL